MKRKQQSTISNGVRRVQQIQSGIGRQSEKNLASTARSTSPLISRGAPNYCLEPVDFPLTVLFFLLHSAFPDWRPSHNAFLPRTLKKNPTILKLSSLPLQSENRKVVRKCQGLEPGCFCLPRWALLYQEFVHWQTPEAWHFWRPYIVVVFEYPEMDSLMQRIS